MEKSADRRRSTFSGRLLFFPFNIGKPTKRILCEIAIIAIILAITVIDKTARTGKNLYKDVSR